jgi:hypothetical protein
MRVTCGGILAYGVHVPLPPARREAPPERQINTDRNLALVNNIGGQPGACVSFVAIVGTELG